MLWIGVILVTTLLVGAFAIYQWRKRCQQRPPDVTSERMERRLEELQSERIFTDADEWQAEEEG
jgi:hypothetical protein